MRFSGRPSIRIQLSWLSSLYLLHWVLAHSCHLYYYSTDEGTWQLPLVSLKKDSACNCVRREVQSEWKASWTWSQKKCAWPWASLLVLWRLSFLIWKTRDRTSPFHLAGMLWWPSDKVCKCALYTVKCGAFIQQITGGLPCAQYTYSSQQNITPCSYEAYILAWGHRTNKMNIFVKSEGIRAMKGNKTREGYKGYTCNLAEDVTIEQQPGQWGERTRLEHGGSKLQAQQTIAWTQKPYNPAL